MRDNYKIRDLEAFLHNNDVFHSYIARLAGNSFGEQSVRSVVTLTNIDISLLDPFYEYQEVDVPSFNEHQILLAAFSDNDVRRAEYAMRVHVLSTRSDIDFVRLKEAQLHQLIGKGIEMGRKNKQADTPCLFFERGKRLI